MILVYSADLVFEYRHVLVLRVTIPTHCNAKELFYWLRIAVCCLRSVYCVQFLCCLDS